MHRTQLGHADVRHRVKNSLNTAVIQGCAANNAPAGTTCLFDRQCQLAGAVHHIANVRGHQLPVR